MLVETARNAFFSCR